MAVKRCPILNCRRGKKASQVMCREHWYMVPAWLRTRVWGLFTTQQGSAAHRKAVLEAVMCVNRQVKEQRAESEELRA
jgi:hypothetical protein